MSQKLVFLQAVVLLTIFDPKESLVCFPAGLLLCLECYICILTWMKRNEVFPSRVYLLHITWKKYMWWYSISYLCSLHSVLNCVSLSYQSTKEFPQNQIEMKSFTEHRKDKLFKVWCKLICANKNQWGVMSFHLIILQKWMRLVAVWLHQSTGENFLHIDFLSLSVNLRSSKILI